MKRYLSNLFKAPKGFTLVELLVVISIIAILSVIGVTIFTSAQKTARDARRRVDIDAISKAFELNKGATSYTGLDNTQFASGVIPVDSTTANTPKYSITTTTGTATPSAWTSSEDNPSAPASYSTIVTNSGNGATFWIVCARLESGPILAYCIKNSQ